MLKLFLCDDAGAIALDKVMLILGSLAFLMASGSLAFGSGPELSEISPPEVTTTVLKQ